MTKLTYEQQIDNLDMEFASFLSGDRLAIPWGDAAFIAEDADNEIANLKRLLSEAAEFVREYDRTYDLYSEIKKALNND